MTNPSSSVTRVQEQRLARSLTALRRVLSKTRKEIAPYVFDLAPVKVLSEQIGALVVGIDRFQEEADGLPQGRVATSAHQVPVTAERTGMIKIDEVFRETVRDIEDNHHEADPASVEKQEIQVTFPRGMFRLSDVLQLLAAHEKTGILKVELDREIIEIELEDGDLRCARSVDGPIEARLGSILVDSGVIRADQLEIVLLATKNSSDKIGHLLREWTDVSSEQVSNALREQLKMLFGRALTAPSVGLCFYPRERNMNDTSSTPLDVMGLLLESLAEEETPT